MAAGILIIDGCLCSLWLLLGAPIPSPAQVSEPLKVSANSHYFKDAQGAALILNGSQTWNTFPDWDTDGSAQAVDFAAFVKFLTAHGHNFTLLWTVEMSKFCGFLPHQIRRRISRSARFPIREPAPAQRPMAA